MTEAPAWVVTNQALELVPPPEIAQLSKVRSAENTLAITRAIHVMTAQRYRPNSSQTWCNVACSDLAQLLGVPLPHWWRTTPTGRMQWMSANDMITALRGGLYPGWRKLYPAKLGELDITERAAQGLPTVATWWNPAKDKDGKPRPGHIVWVVPTPAGKQGIYVTGAGRNCVEECPIAAAFGTLVPQVEFWGAL